MRLTGAAIVLVSAAVLLNFSTFGPHEVSAQVNSNDNRISLMDDCLPGDPGWTPTGGCDLKPHQGDVSNTEFGTFLTSTLITGLVGHPSWRFEPSHLTINRGRTVHITNNGGRDHTLTQVANFGGGAVAGLNIGMTRAPECPAAPPLVTDVIPPGGSAELTGLAVTEPNQPHKFQCCFHPWMRATIRVQ